MEPLAGDSGALGEILSPSPGSSPEVVRRVEAPGQKKGLVLEVSGSALRVFRGRFGDVQAEATLDLLDFQGSVGLVHHVQDRDDAGLFTLDIGGKVNILDLREGRPEDSSRSIQSLLGQALIGLRVGACALLGGLVDSARSGSEASGPLVVRRGPHSHPMSRIAPLPTHGR